MDTTTPAREELLHLLQGGNAHMSFAEAVADFPPEQYNQPFPKGTYTPWHLLEHLRLTQNDILEFMTSTTYREKDWPRDYWPATDAHATPEDWQHTIQAFQDDLQALQALVRNPQSDLNAVIPPCTGQTTFREILLVADHNAYHIGEFAIMRQVMGTWRK